MTKAVGILRGGFGRVALLDMDTSLVSHVHHHCHVIMKVSGPDQYSVVEGTPMPLRDDSAVLINTWEQHYYPHRQRDIRTVFLALYIEPDWLADTDRNFARCTHPAFFSRSVVGITSQIRRLRGELAERISTENCNFDDETEELIVELTTAIAHQFSDRDLSSAFARNNDYRIRRAIQHMYENRFFVIDLDRVAKSVGLSRPHFNYLFRKCTGVSPGIFGNAIRVEAAVKGLGDRSTPISNIAESLGFSAQGNFTRFFQQHTGAAPRQFRRALAQFELGED